ncbi:MAG: hypothetical protein HUJ98_00855 [Bacteroidaceae bacterium]|nr:hypothetical protein [Bacteroidaceae bacterium]
MDRRNEPEKEWLSKKEKKNYISMKVLVLLAHPNIDNSKMNKVLAEAAVEYKKRLEELAK